MTRDESDNGRDDMLIDGPDFQNPNPKQGNSIADEFNANYLKAYYAKLFPYSDMFKWMSYGNDGKHPSCDQSYFSRKEFSFTLDDEIYLRYLSFKSVAEFESAVKEKCPFKIDIGPVFCNDPSKRHAYAQITPVERELVFDIDITDYDDVRFCCSGADVCCDCWPLMTVAIKVVDTALRGKLLEPKRPHLYWTPCAAHCIDLMLEDIGKIPRVRASLKKAMFINAFVYGGRPSVVNLMRQFTNQRNLHRPAITRFATSFITLVQFHKHKNNLRKLVTSQEWSYAKWSREPAAKKMAQYILQESFWRNIVYSLKLTGPLVKVLRMVDGDKKPAMGYIYEAMDRAKEAIASSFGSREDEYMEAFKMIDQRWDCQLHRPLHAAGYFLNPSIYFDNRDISNCEEVMTGLYECIGRLVPDLDIQDKIGNELGIYQTSGGLFGLPMAIRQRKTKSPDDFGFNHILWVFSGRRGVHCWVCDAKARRLTNEQRSSIVEYFRVYKGNENSRHKKVSLGGPALHPFLVRSYTEILKDFFEEKFLCSQKLLSSEDRYEKVLEMIPDESVTSELRGKWQDSRKSSMSTEDINVVRWGQLKHVLQSGKQKGLRRCVEEIVFSYVYPRLDMEVSKHMNHLLKAPFCVHPKTGRVCVPIDPNRCELFDPTSVPTLSQLLEELNMRSPDTDVETDMDRTSLGKAVAFFRSSFLQPLLKSCKDELEVSYSKKLQQNKDSMNW